MVGGQAKGLPQSWVCVTKAGIAGFPRILAVLLCVNNHNDGIDRKVRRTDLFSH